MEIPLVSDVVTLNGPTREVGYFLFLDVESVTTLESVKKAV